MTDWDTKKKSKDDQISSPTPGKTRIVVIFHCISESSNGSRPFQFNSRVIMFSFPSTRRFLEQNENQMVLMHFSSHVYSGWVDLELSSTAHKEEIKHKWWKQLNWKLLQSEADDDYYSKIELSSDWSRNISSNINLIWKKTVAFAAKLPF